MARRHWKDERKSVWFFCCMSDKKHIHTGLNRSFTEILEPLIVLLTCWLQRFLYLSLSRPFIASEMFSMLHQSNSETLLPARHVLFILGESRCSPPRSRPPSPQRGSCQKFWLPGYFYPFLHLQTHNRHTTLLPCVHTSVSPLCPCRSDPFSISSWFLVHVATDDSRVNAVG